MSGENTYWAAVPSDEIANKMVEWIDRYYKFLGTSGKMDRYRSSYSYYYRAGVNGGTLGGAGEQGELTTISVNSYRNYLNHIAILTTQQQPYFEPKATNSDSQSQSQVILASSLLDYYLRQKRIERNMTQAVDDCLIFDEAFIRIEWDVSGGKVYGKTAMGEPAYEGDIKATNYNPLEVIRDYTRKSPNELPWVILRDIDNNKYDLAAKYPELTEEIMSDSDDQVQLRQSTFNYVETNDNDNIAIYTLLHKATPSMPNGRYVECLYNGTVLIDGPLPYKQTHVHRISPGDQSGTIFGYTVGYDLMPIQQAQDIMLSTVLTNNATHGVQNILVPEGSNLSTTQVAGGLSMMSYDPKLGKPEALQLTQSAPESYRLLDLLEKYGDITSAINSVSKGQPDPSLKSGSALAIIQSMAIQYSIGLQRSYARIGEDVGTSIIEILQDYASVPRVAEIVGKSNRPQMKSFTGEDLSSIARVVVDMGNPLQNTTAGKVQLADAYLEKGLVKNPQQYQQVITTGRLEPIIEGEQKNLLLIKGENENLAAGMAVRALITDDHGEHILEHSTVLADPDIRNDPNNPIVINTLNHINEHMALWQDMPPGMAVLLKHEIPFSPAMLPPMPPMGNADPSLMMSSDSPIEQQALSTNMPSMPTNPLTGQEFDTSTGGL